VAVAPTRRARHLGTLTRSKWTTATTATDQIDAAIARQRSDLPLSEVLDAIGLKGYAPLLREEGIVSLRSLGARGATAAGVQLRALSFIDGDVDKIVRVACSPLLERVSGIQRDERGGFVSWDHARCVSWLRALRGVDVDLPLLLRSEPVLTGALLVAAARSTRELRDTLGLASVERRVRFEDAIARARARGESGDGSAGGGAAGAAAFAREAMTRGGLYSPRFLDSVAPLYNLHMGCENMGPMLYSLVRFTKRVSILEIGAGYTSLFLLQALRDNAAELDAFAAAHAAGRCVVPSAEPGAAPMPWCVDATLDAWRGDGSSSESGAGGGASAHGGECGDTSGNAAAAAAAATKRRGVLHCCDNMAHEHTTAPQVLSAARELGLDAHLQLHVADAWSLGRSFPRDVELDMIWVDFGVATRIDEFLNTWWPRLSPRGGLLLVHSTLTNELTRTWLEKMRARSRRSGSAAGAAGTEGGGEAEAAGCRAFGDFDQLSLLEPHKIFQSSFSIFQKRGAGWTEPTYTRYP
jgi:predicted O-methyltransferase YrrM